MFVVLFEVQPHPDRWDDYLDTAKLLRPELEAIAGFIDNTRFASAHSPGRILSLSTWRDEKSLIRWRTHAIHHKQGQERGRFEIFANYRIRVAQITHDSHPPAGLSLRQHRFDDTEIGAAKATTTIEPLDSTAPNALPAELTDATGLIDLERYDGILDPHPPLLLASWASVDNAIAGTPSLASARVRHTRVIREYGLRERTEAPQYFPDIA